MWRPALRRSACIAHRRFARIGSPAQVDIWAGAILRRRGLATFEMHALRRTHMTLRGAFRSCPRLRPGSLRQWPSHRPDRWPQPSSSATRSVCAPASCRAGANCNFRSEDPDAQTESPSWRPIPPAWTWIASPRRCGQSTTSAPVGLRRTAAMAAIARDLAGAAGSDMAVHARGRGGRRGAGGDLRRRTSVAALLIFVSAAAGAILRRAVAQLQRKRFPATILRGACSPALSARWRFGSS